VYGEKRLRIGLFGGTFDPIHLGHLIIAEEARERAELDRVVFVPSGIPPHKSHGPVSSSSSRLEMTRLAVEGNPGFEVSDFEAAREQASFTIETVRHFRKELGHGAELLLVMGADSILEISTWKNPRELLSESRPIVVSRPGFDLGKLEPWLREQALLVEGVLVDISSTDIRGRLVSGRSVRYLVPPSVLSYIRDNQLYTPESAS
jgi:nicotinate-nucleotide adenylyltransferase